MSKTFRRFLKCLSPSSGHGGAVCSVAWSPDGQLLASASKDRAIKIWNAGTGRELHTCGDDAVTSDNHTKIVECRSGIEDGVEEFGGDGGIQRGAG